jgi:hypothetical protein
MTTTKRKLAAVDEDAMTRAIAMLRQLGGRDREQIDSMLQDRDWATVGRYAAFSCQVDHLHPQPWQRTPCHVGDLEEALREPLGQRSGRREAAELLQKMLLLGLSRFEPDPMAAIKSIEVRPQAK